jgi:hypothetical protein
MRWREALQIDAALRMHVALSPWAVARRPTWLTHQTGFARALSNKNSNNVDLLVSGFGQIYLTVTYI